MLSRLQDAAAIRRSFGEPIQHDGTIIIPVASVAGGGGGGKSRGGAGDEDTDGAGGGFGLRIHPTGVFAVQDGKVRWLPAVDVNRAVLGGQIVAVVALLTVRSIMRMRRTRGQPD